ncbi:MAG: DNA-deoxyinosine glycosylase [Novosphingobium sp.]
MTVTPTDPRKSAFAAIAAHDTRVLILGSFPGDASLAAGQYYAHPRNQFWHLIGAVINQTDLAGLPYAERLALLGQAGIGLWDVIATAVRRGSLDTAIRAAEPAALTNLAAALPQLRAIGLNGAKSAAIGRKALAGSGLTLIDLPSSSPAHASLGLAAKLARWLTIKEFLV